MIKPKILKTAISLIAVSLIPSLSLADLALVNAAKKQIGVTKYYDPSYQKLAYPLGDIPLDRGVCSDVIIRAFREKGIDLQQTVHEDMKANFNLYPKNWGLKSTDRNIDHRRVPNLEKYFERQNYALKVTNNPEDYLPGDIVSWRLDNGLPHIGIVSDELASDDKTYLIIHNIGSGAKLENVLFSWKMIGHYRIK